MTSPVNLLAFVAVSTALLLPGLSLHSSEEMATIRCSSSLFLLTARLPWLLPALLLPLAPTAFTCYYEAPPLTPTLELLVFWLRY